MARIAGIDIPKNKRGVIALTYIFGIGRSAAKEILAQAKVDENIKVQDWNDQNQTFLSYTDNLLHQELYKSVLTQH